MMAPSFEQAAAELAPRVRLAKLNTEKAQSIAARFNIRSIPTLAIFDNGRETARQSGAMNREQLVQWVRANTG
jgi:thioredoxin 2